MFFSLSTLFSFLYPIVGLHLYSEGQMNTHLCIWWCCSSVIYVSCCFFPLEVITFEMSSSCSSIILMKILNLFWNWSLNAEMVPHVIILLWKSGNGSLFCPFTLRFLLLQIIIHWHKIFLDFLNTKIQHTFKTIKSHLKSTVSQTEHRNRIR